MHLSKRLLTICGMVSDGSEIVDVGCDHGLASIYLAKYRNVHVLALDIRKSALAKAEENIKKYHVEESVDIKQNDGLAGIDVADKTILICGMGSHTIKKILASVPKTMREVIVQSNHDVAGLRKYMRTHGYDIVDERYLCEKGKHYILIKFVPGRQKHHRFDDVLGPILRHQDASYLNYYKEIFTRQLAMIPRKYVLKRYRLTVYLRQIEKELNRISI